MGEKFQVLDNRIQELSLLLLQKWCYTPDSGHLSLIMKNIFFTFFSGLTIRQASLNGLVLGALLTPKHKLVYRLQLQHFSQCFHVENSACTTIFYQRYSLSRYIHSIQKWTHYFHFFPTCHSNYPFIMAIFKNLGNT